MVVDRSPRDESVTSNKTVEQFMCVGLPKNIPGSQHSETGTESAAHVCGTPCKIPGSQRSETGINRKSSSCEWDSLQIPGSQCSETGINRESAAHVCGTPAKSQGVSAVRLE